MPAMGAVSSSPHSSTSQGQRSSVVGKDSDPPSQPDRIAPSSSNGNPQAGAATTSDRDTNKGNRVSPSVQPGDDAAPRAPSIQSSPGSPGAGGTAAGPPTSPYSVGVPELQSAQAAMEKLGALKTSPQTYVGANAALLSPSNLSSWVSHLTTGRERPATTIEEQTEDEDAVTDPLKRIAAANVRGEVQPGVLRQAQTLDDTLMDRLTADYNNASQAAGDSHPDSLQTAYNRTGDGWELHTALNDVRPDVVSLDQTPTFLTEADSFNQKVQTDAAALHSASSPAAHDAAIVSLQDDEKQLDKLYGLVDTQAGDAIGGGISGTKILALPDDDPLSTVYQKQAHDLIDLTLPPPPSPRGALGGPIFQASQTLFSSDRPPGR